MKDYIEYEAVPQCNFTSWFDRRLLTHGHNEFAYEAVIPGSVEEWQARRAFVRERLRLAACLPWMPEKKTLSPEIWGEFEQGGVLISKVRFESLDGLSVTGNIYRPAGEDGMLPGILAPHGHWDWGRLEEEEQCSVVRCCLKLARLGFVVFSYDMIGYCDNSNYAHTWPVSLLRRGGLDGVSPFMLQTWNSIRALDFICGLPYVDAERIGITGASGGATQTWILSALDERIKVLAPAVMLSLHYQGGCACEEGPLLRLHGLTSFDIAAASAPKPLLLTATTRDWTNLNLRYELPKMRQVYDLFGKSDLVSCYQQDTGHNYNCVSREQIYAFLTYWLKGGEKLDSLPEGELSVPSREQLLHGGRVGEASAEETAENVARVAKQLSWGGEVKVRAGVLGVDLSCHDICQRFCYQQPWEVGNGYEAVTAIISRRGIGDTIPAVMVRKPQNQARTAWLVLPGKGKAECFDGTPEGAAVLAGITSADGTMALVADILGNGETAAMVEQCGRDEDHQTFFAFNQSLFSLRVQDVVTCLRLLQESGYEEINVQAWGETVRPALAALSMFDGVSRAVINLSGVSDTYEAWLAKLSFAPMAYRLGGLKGFVADCRASSLEIANADNDIRQYVAAGQGDGKMSGVRLS